MAKNGDEHMRSTIFTTDKEAQYDEKAKKILGQKQVLAHILMFCFMFEQETDYPKSSLM